jgi:predicted TIM-barrel fold metal-dependent hydrolase
LTPTGPATTLNVIKLLSWEVDRHVKGQAPLVGAVSTGDFGMRYFGRQFAWTVFCLLCSPAFADPPSRFTLSTMPRVDVHAHIPDKWEVIDQYMGLRDAIKKDLNVEMAMWISLSGSQPPDSRELQRRYQGRILWTINCYDISHGLKFAPQELVEWQAKGVGGFKFYPGWKRGVQVDHPANDPIFDKMEQIGMIGASVHVSNPCGIFGQRTEWIPDPVEFWRQQHAWENVLKKHPRLVVVNAHMLMMFFSDTQLDYLRYMLSTYPNLNVDLATVPEFLYNTGRDNLRDFMITYADRVLFGTDVGTSWFAPDLGGAANKIETRAPNYKRYFDYLETDKTLPCDFVDVTKGQNGVRSNVPGKRTIQGLALPQDVLEKIYFRNAMRLYPHVKDNLKKLGYPVE